jgi:hypothetical protein
MPIPTEFEFQFPVSVLPVTCVPLDHLMAACARGMVETQQALDDRARESMDRWEEDGIPPSALALRQCRVQFPTTLTIVPKRSGVERARLHLHPRFEDQARVTVSYLYVSEPQSE